MKKSPEEFKNSIIARMLPPKSESVSKLSPKTGIPRNTLNYWRLTHAEQKKASSGQGSGLSSEDIFAIVLESASMNEHGLSAYCRGKGLYPQQSPP